MKADRFPDVLVLGGVRVSRVLRALYPLLAWVWACHAGLCLCDALRRSHFHSRRPGWSHSRVKVFEANRGHLRAPQDRLCRCGWWSKMAFDVCPIWAIGGAGCSAGWVRKRALRDTFWLPSTCENSIIQNRKSRPFCNIWGQSLGTAPGPLLAPESQGFCMCSIAHRPVTNEPSGTFPALGLPVGVVAVAVRAECVLVGSVSARGPPRLAVRSRMTSPCPTIGGHDEQRRMAGRFPGQ